MTLRVRSATPSPASALQAPVRRLRELLPRLTAVILFGSRASGLADDFSDYDLIVLLPNGLDSAKRRAVADQLRAEFPAFHLDLVFGSRRSLLASLRYEPARRFWLENGLALWGRKPVVKRYPPLAKGALLSHLNLVEAEMGVAQAEDTAHARGRVCADALEHLLQIEFALAGDYRNESVQQTLAQLIGRDFLRALRDPAQPIAAAESRRLFRITREKLRTLKAQVQAMPENELDRVWREQWRKHEPTKAT